MSFHRRGKDERGRLLMKVVSPGESAESGSGCVGGGISTGGSTGLGRRRRAGGTSVNRGSWGLRRRRLMSGMSSNISWGCGRW